MTRTGMNRKVIITCALTGAGDTVGKSEHVPVTPEQIAESGIEAARAGAAIVHVHVRDPNTGAGSRDVSLYREVVQRLRKSDVDMVVNTTAGMGGDLYLNPDDPSGFAEGTDLVNGIERLAHVEELRPDICTLDCGVGAGVIGGGWVAYFLARGFRVHAWEPAPNAEARLRTIVEAAWPALTELGLADGATMDNLTVDAELATAVGEADYVQESAPEQLDVKRRLLADIAAAVPEHVVIGSSTSGYGMTEMAVDVASAQRLVVAHPFNPPYLIPLVEVVGGERTAADVVRWTSEFHQHIGKSVITLDREVPGFIANRLQEALWREALHMVANGEATVEQIDASITEGPGLRWAFQGPMLTFHLAGGPGGMGHMLDHFGPSLLSPWTRLAAPELTPELRDSVVRGCEEEAGSRSVADLVRERDQWLVDVLRLLGKEPHG